MIVDPVCGKEGIGRLIERGVGLLRKLGYSPSYVSQNRRIWRHFAVYTGNARKAYSDPLCLGFLKSCGITKRNQGRRLEVPERNIRTAMRVLGEIHERGEFSLRMTVGGRPSIPSWFQEACLAHERFCREKKGMLEVSIKQHSNRLRRFFRFMERQGITGWDGLSANLLSRFLHTLTPLRRAGRRGYTDSLRSFFRSLFCLGILPMDWANFVPKTAPVHDVAHSYPWSPEEIGRLLGILDRSTASGKRDYAFLLLVARLGIRSGDACSLRLENFDWTGNAIRFIQEKTGIAHVLPLLPDIGMAVVDYLRHGRPNSPCREVFLRHRGPNNEPLGRTAMNGALRSAKKKAGIKIPKSFRAGLHSLRHSLATRLLEEGAPWPSISAVMGHVCPDTTQVYAKSSMSLLRKVAIDPEEVCYG